MNNIYSTLLNEVKATFPFTKYIKVEISVSEKDIIEFDRYLKKFNESVHTINVGEDTPEDLRFTRLSNWNGHLIINHNGE